MNKKNIISKKIENLVFDENSRKALFKLANNNIIDSIDSPISTGKEAVTFLGNLRGKFLVAKIYKIETSKFKHMYKYIEGDYRFKKFSKDKRNITLIWASKEYKNLILASKYGVSCPLALAREKNILIMSFVGNEDGIAAPRLKDFRYDFDIVYPQIIENYSKLLYGAKLVHGDFSPYNILIDPDTQKISIIDFGQAVVTSHPKAKDFLKRDIINITDFLNKKNRSENLSYEKVISDMKNKKDEIYGRNNKD